MAFKVFIPPIVLEGVYTSTQVTKDTDFMDWLLESGAS